MIESFTRKSLVATGAALLAALGVGGAAIAQSTAPSPPQKADPPAGELRETPGQESSSEVPGDDGPGGHADEPSNPNADHQFQGVE